MDSIKNNTRSIRGHANRAIDLLQKTDLDKVQILRCLIEIKQDLVLIDEQSTTLKEAITAMRAPEKPTTKGFIGRPAEQGPG